MNGTITTLLNLLQQFPQGNPKDDYKWLPTSIANNIYSNYLEVPENISSYHDLAQVVGQANLDLVDFMYLLGFTLADGYVQRTSKTSFSLRSTLSTVYDWSIDILENLSQSLSPLAHSTIHNTERNPNDILEFSNSSPLFVWIREVVFGLKPLEKKTYSEFNGDWILRAPEDLRIAFLQGIADGDGYASVIAQRIGLGSIRNAKFIHQLLATLGIKSYLRKKGVETIQHDSIFKAASLPIFRHANDKTEALNELCEMLRDRPRRKAVSSDEIKIIVALAKKGLSKYRVAYHLWKKYRISRSPATIGRIIKENS